VVYEILAELIRHGVRNIVVLSGHAGKSHMMALRLAAQKIVNEHEVHLLVLSDYDILAPKEGELFEKGDSHAGAVETSRILALRNELVKGSPGPTKPDLPRFMVLRHPEECFPTGVMGDPRSASVAKGEELNEIIVQELEGLIEHMKRYD
jgi:creatinine amidohydrolase